MKIINQNTNFNLMVFMTDSLDRVLGKTGVTLEIYMSKNGGIFSLITPTVTERGYGWYNLLLTNSHTDTLGVLVFHIIAPNADPTDMSVQVIEPVLSLAGIADAVWDETLTGANHNIPTSAGRRLRQLAGNIVWDGIAQGAGINGNQIILDLEASAITGTYDPSTIAIVLGTGIGQCRNILEYDGPTRTATVDRNWKVLPDNTSEFIIYANAGREHVNEGLLRSATINTAQLNVNASGFDNNYVNQTIFLRSGLGEDQSRVVIAYDSTTKTVTIDRDWDLIPDDTTAYVMLPGLATSAILEENLTNTMIKIADLHSIQGLDVTDPVTITPDSKNNNRIHLDLTGDGETETIITRT